MEDFSGPVRDYSTATACFFCHTDDGVRFVACAGPSPEPSKKPDKLGTVCLVACFTDTGLSTTICSNGTVKIVSEGVGGGVGGGEGKGKWIDPLSKEYSRVVGAKGMVMRTLIPPSCSVCSTVQEMKSGWGKGPADGNQTTLTLTRGEDAFGGPPTCNCHFPYVQDVIQANGTRTLIRNPKFTCTDDGEAPDLSFLPPFHQELLGEAPQDWEYISLDVAGSVLFYTSDSSFPPIPHPAMISIKSNNIDAQTRSEVSAYTDGRLLIVQKNKRSDCYFGDGTKVTSHSSGNLVYISKEGLPSVEIDVEVDDMCRSHSQGMEALSPLYRLYTLYTLYTPEVLVLRVLIS